MMGIFLTGTHLYVLLCTTNTAEQSQLGPLTLVLHGRILHLIWHKSDGGDSDRGLSSCRWQDGQTMFL